ncbi:hypothetical protein Clacol_006727 [Clathrus columnatus]|uniref:Clavaminate synthase-like protein n=1 Tax=Clathrus columnatus TaxID=1419009 RepID=A0AAV5AHX7_9AGAM|nr:hypothetical protein Clacol_006727 [Clathrus columnatus]
MGETTFHGQDIPPFPDDVPTHPLLVIDYEKLKQGEKLEKVSRASSIHCAAGSLKNHNVDIQPMWEMGEATMALPLDVKMNFEQGDGGRSFGYKAAGTTNTDEHGSLDTVEFINVSKDDALAWPKIVHREYPITVTTRMSSIKKFIQESDAVLRTMLDIMSEYLDLPVNTLRDRHVFGNHSGSECRVIRNPPKRVPGDQVALGAHTDFGSLVGFQYKSNERFLSNPSAQSFLHHNIIGGLQVLNVASKGWEYVKNKRPHATAVMEPLTESPLVASSVAAKPIHIDKGVTAGEWFNRRVKYQRAANRTGPEAWRASRGTENARLELASAS